MSPFDLTDPAAFTHDALALLPENPTEATADDLADLGAISEGLARITRSDQLRHGETCQRRPVDQPR